MNLRSQYKALKGAHFFDVTTKEGSRSVRVSAPNQRLVMQCLFEYLGKNKEAWPSQLSISIWCGFTSPSQLEQYRTNGSKPSLNTVKRILKALEENHYIQVERVKVGDAGRKTQNVYRIIWSNLAGINNHQTQFFFDDYQSPTELHQSPTDQNQSPTASDQSPTGGTQKHQSQTPQEKPNSKTHEMGRDKDSPLGLDRSDPDFKHKACLALQICETIEKQFNLRTPTESKVAAEHALKVANCEWPAEFVHDAIRETLKRRPGIPPPSGGLAKLNYFGSVMNRLSDELVNR